MIYSRETHERSPLRVFEKSIHGGLGPGNLGVVMSRPGVGKTAFLIGVAIDDLLQERRVLHVTLEDPIERVRAFYDTIFAELARTLPLEGPERAHARMERLRMILHFPQGTLPLERLRWNLDFLRDHADFRPRLLILDGVDFYATTSEELSGLRGLAGEAELEIWLSAVADPARGLRDPRGVDEGVVRFEEHIAVIVLLHSEEEGAVTIQLLKDHDNPDVADLRLKLDPTTLLLKAER
ncbi:MAG: hypothetical protein FJY75_09700 [Candidatus Eisenbacteria bacterium]|uniref:KaiC-like domain-containing protein n=1 Tax=Eiseniibacteriota bacterium TaxID=2212470 RepID=A0A938BP96_UNCEI|nr:hypothetical protein [Candidatus Eisenbacteria bacterium]